MALLGSVALEDYNTIRETNPEEAIVISHAKHVNATEQTSQAKHCIIVSRSVFGS